MKVWQYMVALAVVVGLAIATIWQHVRMVRAGYRLQALERDRDRLDEQRRKLELKLAAEERWDALVERARALGIAVPGEEPPLPAAGHE